MSPGSDLLLPANLEDLSRIVRSPAAAVAAVEVLRDGQQAFPAMLGLIASAQRSVCFENFIFAGDATGRKFAAALGAAKRRGVDVRVIYDPVGTMMVKGGSIARALAAEGVAARAFRPVSLLAPRAWPRLRHRDHRKTLVVDGEAAVVGGLCISDNWAAHAWGGRNWRDTALLVRGAVVAQVAAAFETMWRSAAGAPDEIPPCAALPAAPPPCGMVAADFPGAHCVREVYIWLAEHASQSLDITDAYLVAPEPMVAAFEAAARRGVRVRFLLPGNSNHPVAAASARRLYARLMESGARIHESRGEMVHAKTAVADRAIVLVGSSNLDPLSMTCNFELNLLVADPATGARLGEMFEEDLRGAGEIHPGEWARRPWWQKAAEIAAGSFDGNL
jgi:cardiolipin synthase A/B